MSRNDFKNPLIQSGLILIGVFLLIAIVVNSPADGFFSGIFAIVIAFFKGLLFLIGLSIALVCSIGVLIGVFLLATYFYSADKAKYFYAQLRKQSTDLYCSIRKCSTSGQNEKEQEAPCAPPSIKKPAEASVPEENIALAPIETRIRKLEESNNELKSGLEEVSGVISSLSQSIEDIKQSLSSEAAPEATPDVQSSIEQIERLETRLTDISTRVVQVEKKVDNEMQAVQKELTELESKCSVPEMISGILSYIDSPEDREKVNQTAEEAVSRGMTYSQADELFKKNLPAKIYKTLNAHPRLTKDFIRSVKKKFA